MSELLYLSGPMGDKDYPWFDVAAVSGHASGYRVFNPMNHDYDATPSRLPASWFREQVGALSGAATVWFLPGWENARGCIAEFFLASLLGCRIYAFTAERTLDDISVEPHRLNRRVEQLLSTQQDAFTASTSPRDQT